MGEKIKYRLFIIIITIISVSIGLMIILGNMSNSIIFFYSPSQLNEIPNNKEIRIGGILKEGSLQRISQKKVRFNIQDSKESIAVEYEGILPGLFRENQGIVAKGIMLDSQFFIANELLIKHDENYKPA